MKRYEFPTPRLALGIAAVALPRSPWRIAGRPGEPRGRRPARSRRWQTPRQSGRAESDRTEMIVTPSRIDVIARARRRPPRRRAVTTPGQGKQQV